MYPSDQSHISLYQRPNSSLSLKKRSKTCSKEQSGTVQPNGSAWWNSSIAAGKLPVTFARTTYLAQSFFVSAKKLVRQAYLVQKYTALPLYGFLSVVPCLEDTPNPIARTQRHGNRSAAPCSLIREPTKTISNRSGASVSGHQTLQCQTSQEMLPASPIFWFFFEKGFAVDSYLCLV